MKKILYINKINYYYYLEFQWLLSWLWLLLKETAVTQRLFEDVILTAHKHATLTVEPEVSSYKLIWCQWLIRQSTSLSVVSKYDYHSTRPSSNHLQQFPQRKKNSGFFVGCPICNLIKSPWSNVRASWPRLRERERASEWEWPTSINKQS